MIERTHLTNEPCGAGHRVMLVETRGSRLGEPLGRGKPRWHCECPPCGMRGKAYASEAEAMAPFRAVSRPVLTLTRSARGG